MSNISACSSLYYTDENGKEYSLLKLYAYGKCVWKKEKPENFWVYVVKITDNKAVYFKADYLHVSKEDTIDWGDGIVTKGVDMVDKSTIEHTYEKEGVYTITYNDTQKANTSYGDMFYPDEALQKIIHPDYCTEIRIYANDAGNIAIEYVMPTKITTVVSVQCGIVNMNIPTGVIEICSSAFTKATKMKKITLPDTLKTIGVYAFQGAVSLEDISLPDSVTSIGHTSFNGTTHVKNIRLSNSLTTIPEYSFCYCGNATDGIKSLVIPKNVRTIEKSAFYTARITESIILNEGLEYIKEYAFYSACRSAYEITFPKTLKNIGKYAFAYSGFENLLIPVNITTLGDNCFEYSSELTTLTIGEKNNDYFLGIGNYCFKDCENLTTITINRQIGRIGNSAFYNIGNYLNNYKYVTLNLNAVVRVIDANAFWSVQIKKLNFKSGLLRIGSDAFRGNTALETLTLPNTLRTIEENAFRANWQLEEIDIPASVTSIGKCAFLYGNRISPLKKIIIRGNPTIGEHALGYYINENNAYGLLNCTFYGIAGSNTETYAKNNGFEFVAI